MSIFFAHLPRNTARAALRGAALVALLSSCAPIADFDLRGGGGVLNTNEAALEAVQRRLPADSRGVISYPGYQVALAQQGDSVATLAQRLGIESAALARFNALNENDLLRAGEVIVLPYRIGPAGAQDTAPPPGSVDIEALASNALDRVDGAAQGEALGRRPLPLENFNQPDPLRHQVRPGDTAFSIARTYNVPVRALIEWNNLPANMSLREGQILIIPSRQSQVEGAVANAPLIPFAVVDVAPTPPVPVHPVDTASALVFGPGEGSIPPEPPSAELPLPEHDLPPIASVLNTPPPAELGADRTQASSAQMVLPTDGPIVREFKEGHNQGIDISAPGGTPVVAADDGVVAVITTDTAQTSIIIVRHEDNILTAYAGVDGILVEKGARVRRGQTIASVQEASPSLLNFQVLRGNRRLDPADFLQ